MLSELKRITASIVQGSGIGPTASVLTASDLRALSFLIFLNKYADDCYLIVPPDQASLISTELAHVERWAQDNNLKLNVLKTKEMIVRRPRTRLGNIPPPTPGIERVLSMKILGVVFEENFTFREHVERLVTQSNQGLYAIKTLRAQGLSGTHLWNVTRATIVARMTYVSPSWWGLLDEGSRQRLQAILTKMQKQGLLPCDYPTMMELCDAADTKLFAAILHNPHHVLHCLLPPVRESTYNLRQRPLDRMIPLISCPRITHRFRKFVRGPIRGCFVPSCRIRTMFYTNVSHLLNPRVTACANDHMIGLSPSAKAYYSGILLLFECSIKIVTD